ncbi:MAG: DUF87 domain-containing protein [Anaerolineae bacterium]|nr:DUF87 domain-containing protein [Anaerolineae bacterium]
MKVKSRSPARPADAEPTSPSPWAKRIWKELPPFADELLAFILIGLGLFSFLILLSPESGEMGTFWSILLRQLFGVGAFVIPALVLAAGAILLVPKMGVVIRINWWRFAMGEVFFVLLLAIIHSQIRVGIGGEAGRIEAFAQAMEGRGGGLVGWAIQYLIHLLLGDMVTGIVLISALVLSGLMMIGVRRRQLLERLDHLQEWALKLADQWEPPDPPEPSAERKPIQEIPLPRPQMVGDGMVELPAFPGRPSIVTGERGAGAVIAARPGGMDGGQTPFRQGGDRPTTRIERLKARHNEKHDEMEIRFQLEEMIDQRKTRKRSDKLPSLDLLDDVKFGRPSDEEINISATIIEETVADFGMQVKVIGVKAGPTVTQYAVQPFTEVERDGEKVIQRVRVTRVAGLANDLSLALAAPSVRIQAPVPGTSYIGIEVPNMQPGVVSLRPVIESEQFYEIKSPLALALGREVDGRPFAVDLAKMPHMLIGGTTGSGKSVCLRSIATCLVSNNRPDKLRLIMIDPKMVELVRFNGLPHLLGRVEVQLDRIIGVLRWITREMDRRYKLMEEALARNIEVYNRGRYYKHRMPHIVVLIDELAELMMEYPDETEHLITRLAQMARATGIHLVVATQRPSTDVVTGLIKANFPARISFAVASGTDSRVIIDTVGAEDLIGRGDMLYQSPEAAAPARIQGCFVGDNEMERIVDYWVDNWEWEEDVSEAPWERSLRRQAVIEETDEMLIEAIRIVQNDGEASASQLQRKLNVGYPRAGRIVDSLFRLGVVGPEETGGRTREVLIKPGEDPVDYILKQRTGRL